MEKLDENQKKFIIEKSKEFGLDTELTEKLSDETWSALAPEEWERMRLEVINCGLDTGAATIYELTPILSKGFRDQPFLLYMYDRKEMVGAICMLGGILLIMGDHSIFELQKMPPAEWAREGIWGQLKIFNHKLNWTSSAWSGLISAVFGAIWSFLGRFFVK